MTKYLIIFSTNFSKNIEDIVHQAIVHSFKQSKLYAALWSDDTYPNDFGAHDVFNNIDWWSEPIEIDAATGQSSPLIDLILENLFTGTVLWLCEQRLIATTAARTVADLVQFGLDVMRSGPIYHVLIVGPSDASVDRTPIELLEKCNWWRRDGVMRRLHDADAELSWVPI